MEPERHFISIWHPGCDGHFGRAWSASEYSAMWIFSRRKSPLEVSKAQARHSYGCSESPYIKRLAKQLQIKHLNTHSLPPNLQTPPRTGFTDKSDTTYHHRTRQRVLTKMRLSSSRNGTESSGLAAVLLFFYLFIVGCQSVNTEVAQVGTTGSEFQSFPDNKEASLVLKTFTVNNTVPPGSYSLSGFKHCGSS